VAGLSESQVYFFGESNLRHFFGAVVIDINSARSGSHPEGRSEAKHGAKRH
jgi:hypothetical protein